MEKETIIELKNIRKEFPGVVALDNVNMKIRASEVHALVGENGAGKSTLMKILSGTYSNYGGSVICKGEEIHMKCEKDAFKYGISIVAQELNYVSELSIAENLFLGREPKKGKVFVNKAERLKETQRLLDEMGLDYNPREKMGKGYCSDIHQRSDNWGCEQSEIFRTWLYFGDSGSGSHYAPFCNCDRCSDEINKVWNLYLCDRWK